MLQSRPVLQLVNRHDEYWLIQGHFNLFFIETDFPTLETWYDFASQLHVSTELKVTFYCDENHIIWKEAVKSWVDMDYTYIWNGEQKTFPYILRSSNPSAKPGEVGIGPGNKRSYASHGNYAVFLTSRAIYISC